MVLLQPLGGVGPARVGAFLDALGYREGGVDEAAQRRPRRRRPVDPSGRPRSWKSPGSGWWKCLVQRPTCVSSRNHCAVVACR